MRCLPLCVAYDVKLANKSRTTLGLSIEVTACAT